MANDDDNVKSKRQAARIGLLGICVLGLLLLQLTRARRPSAPPPLARLLVRPANARSPSEEALWTARWHRMQAQQAVNQERQDLFESLAPEASADIDREDWRRELMARDRTGHLKRARAAALQAAGLARTAAEEYQARVWLVLIECDAGHHVRELQHARRLWQLQPRNELSLTSLRHAARCNGLARVARWMTLELEALREERQARRKVLPDSVTGGHAHRHHPRPHPPGR
jgi:hypothetical protein